MLLNELLSIAKKEILDNIRNKWIILITILFISLTLLVSYAGSIFSDGWQDLAITISGMSVLVQYLISIIALMLGYASIVGEIERGSMGPLLSLPSKRWEILLGKFIGLGSVLSFTILVGFGIAGLIIGINVPNTDYLEYLIFIGNSILMGLSFLSLGIFLSVLFQKRSTAMGGAIFLWFLFSIIWQFISAAILISSNVLQNLQEFSLPDWYYVFQLFNPLSVYSYIVTLNIGSITSGQQDFGGFSLPDFYNSYFLSFVLICWIIIPLIFAFWRFNKKDI